MDFQGHFLLHVFFALREVLQPVPMENETIEIKKKKKEGDLGGSVG